MKFQLEITIEDDGHKAHYRCLIKDDEGAQSAIQGQPFNPDDERESKLAHCAMCECLSRKLTNLVTPPESIHYTLVDGRRMLTIPPPK